MGGKLSAIGFVLILIFSGGCDGKVSPKISCDNDEMQVELGGTNILDAYLKGLKNYPEPACIPNRSSSGDLLTFRLSLIEFARCGTSQILNKITGSITFYNHIVIIDREGKDTEILVKCKLPGTDSGLPSTPEEMGENHLNNGTLRLRKRDVLPAGFEEQESPIPYGDRIGHGPEPILSMVVKQEGRTIGQELLVQPGAPLTMEVSHIERPIRRDDTGLRFDDNVYGIIVSKLDVTDTQDQSEVILINGCSVDPYLFENFQTSNGDTLVAKFRAFKFPDSSYVLFQGTVNVCLGSCRPSQCSNGQIGYGRRRRSLSNGLYEVRVNSLIRISNPETNLDEGVILYRAKRLNTNQDYQDNSYRLGSNENILAQYRTNGVESITNGKGKMKIAFVLLGSIFVHRFFMALS